jgi:hypothetical protein
MGDDIAVYEGQADLSITRAPVKVLEEARGAAKALKDVVSKKNKPVILNGEQYLEFEDWQTLGRFYGVTAKVISTAHIDYGRAQGFEAKAIALRLDGTEISAAEAMCLSDEPNWRGKPLFQLRSMAQTRACAKALRNVLAWVVVLAGYKPTPAEEMTGGKSAAPSVKLISEGQKKFLLTKAKAKTVAEKDILEAFKLDSIDNVPVHLFSEVLAFIEKGVIVSHEE